MNSLLSLTLITGVTDSFNPFGIAQQFTLQGKTLSRSFP